MLGGILAWAVIAVGVGHADTARMLAAIMLVRAARAFTMLDTGAALRKRHGAAPEIARKSLRRAIRIELASLIAAALILAIMVLVLWQIEQRAVAWMTVLISVGLPARHLGPAAGGRRRAGVFQAALNWSGLALALLCLVAGLEWPAFALALGVRQWIALLISLAPANQPGFETERTPVETPLTWREVAGITGRRARHRFAYRIGKSLLGILGPVGNIAARTARGVGAHRRVVPNTIWPVAAVAAGAAGAGLLLPVILAKPATLLASASLLRVAASAGNVLIWWPFVALIPDDPDDDDEDDD